MKNKMLIVCCVLVLLMVTVTAVSASENTTQNLETSEIEEVPISHNSLENNNASTSQVASEIKTTTGRVIGNC